MNKATLGRGQDEIKKLTLRPEPTENSPKHTGSLSQPACQVVTNLWGPRGQS